MPATVVVGLQWRDEGKAKVLDELSERADIVCRFQGGANAGHTVVVEGEKYKFHLVPCGVARAGKQCVVGNGVALDPVGLLEEIRHFESRGLDVRDRLVISDRAHLVGRLATWDAGARACPDLWPAPRMPKRGTAFAMGRPSLPPRRNP